MKVINGQVDLLHSKGQFDWLGKGAYFWESDPHRAYEWAESKAARGDYKEPFVIGAAIDLGNCLDLMVRENIELVRLAYQSFAAVQAKAGLPMPENRKAPKDESPDLVLRYLDCAVINHLHSIIAGKMEPFDTIRGLFGEGSAIYEGSGFRERTHVQIAVLNLLMIKGVFLPLPR